MFSSKLMLMSTSSAFKDTVHKSNGQQAINISGDIGCSVLLKANDKCRALLSRHFSTPKHYNKQNMVYCADKAIRHHAPLCIM